MPQPYHNPFYGFLVASCAALLITMFVCVTMWVAPKTEAPPWVIWIDHYWMRLIVGEVAAILTFGVLTIGLDQYFDRSSARRRSATPTPSEDRDNPSDGS